MIKQGQKVKIGNQEAYANAFTTEEMYVIYMCLCQSKEVADETLNECPVLKKLSSEERQEIEEMKDILKHINSAIQKIETTFENLGVEI